MRLSSTSQIKYQSIRLIPRLSSSTTSRFSPYRWYFATIRFLLSNGRFLQLHLHVSCAISPSSRVFGFFVYLHNQCGFLCFCLSVTTSTFTKFILRNDFTITIDLGHHHHQFRFLSPSPYSLKSICVSLSVTIFRSICTRFKFCHLLFLSRFLQIRF